MSISNYTELKSAVSRWLARGDLAVDSTLADLIALGEARIYRKLRVRDMEVAISSAITDGVVALPSGYLQTKHLRIVSGWQLARKTAEWVYATYPQRSASGTPKFFATDAGSFIFGPYPDSGYTLKGTYYARPAALSDTNSTNWLLTSAPDVLLFAALCEAEPKLQNDPRIAIWEAKYATVYNDLQDAEKAEMYSGSPLSMTAR